MPNECGANNKRLGNALGSGLHGIGQAEAPRCAIAKQLHDQPGLGILYATGNASNVVLTSADGHACISKPYSEAGLLRALDLVAELVATGNATPPYPKGFKVLAAPLPAVLT